MIPELGHFALCLAAGLSLMQCVAPLAGVAAKRERWQAMAWPLSVGQVVFTIVAYLALTWSFIDIDFSVRYVATNAHTELPLFYRISAVWGGHEGSLLLWVLMLGAWTLLVAGLNKSLPRDVGASVLGVMGAISFAFLLFTLLTSNPFERLFPAPAEGQDLNPLLQDPGLIIHPPMLYMGYVGFSVAFAFAVAALISGRLDAAWARWTRPWTTLAWSFLTVGILLGSWWAYNELGWGGWWFWDPVENASFMPWLVGTALIHSLAVTEKRGLFKAWTVLLAISAFALSLLGTFLVRSGVLVSVHAFATDPSRGVFVLMIFAFFVGGALLLFALRAARFQVRQRMTLFSREGLLLLNNVFLSVAALAVLLGTLYPLFVDAMGMGKLSVGPPYFDAVFAPLTLPLVVLVAFAMPVMWKRGQWSRVREQLWLPLVAAVVVTAIVAVAGVRGLGVSAAILMAVWCIAGALAEPVRVLRRRSRVKLSRSQWGMTLAHCGLGVFVLGVALVNHGSIERDVRLAPGETVEFSGYLFQFGGVSRQEGPNFHADVGLVDIMRDGRLVATLEPEKRYYRMGGNPMTEAAIDISPLRDLYVSLGEPVQDGAWILRLYVKPLIRWIWLGSLMMALGGALAASDRRYRLKSRAPVSVASASSAQA